MPRTLTFPSPSPEVCPVCDVRLAAIPCRGCGADLHRDEAIELGQVDHELHRLAVVRGVIVDRLLAGPMPVPPPPDRSGPPPPPPLKSSTAGGGRGPSRWSTAEILVGLGGLSLVAAVVVFAAVTWSALAAWVQGGLLLAATGAVLGAAVTCRRRSLGATAESLGVVSFVLGLADVQVVRSALDGVVSSRSSWSIGLAVVATAGIVVGRRVGLRGLAAAGVAAAFVPIPLLTASAAAPVAAAWALGGQALLAAVVLSAVGTVSLERPILAAGAAVSWFLAVGIASGDAVLDLVDEPWSAPLGGIAVLTVLASGSVIVSIPTRLRSLAAGGTILAFVPGALLATGLGTPSWVAATFVGQCALGLAAGEAVRGRLESSLAHVIRRGSQVGASICAAGAVVTATFLGLVAPWVGPETVSVSAVATFLALAAVSVGGAVSARWGRNVRAGVLVLARPSPASTRRSPPTWWLRRRSRPMICPRGRRSRNWRRSPWWAWPASSRGDAGAQRCRRRS